MTPQDFVYKWRTVQLKERSFYQEHFLDVCKLIGHSTPAETDKTGASFTFEAATPGRVGAGRGFADVWKQNAFAIFTFLGKDSLADEALGVIASDSDYVFGVLQSKVHELWARGTGSQLRDAESGFRYTPTTTFETFPFPWPPGQVPRQERRSSGRRSQQDTLPTNAVP